VRFYVHGLVLLVVVVSLALAFALPVLPQSQAGPQGMYFPGPPFPTSGGLGDFTNLDAGPGSISITGNSMNGMDSITGMARVNDIMFANYFAGADIGQKVNNAISALGTGGGIVHIAAGNYQFTNTIYCPNNDTPVIIQGDGVSNMGDSNATWYQHGTRLNYTGNGDAVNQLLAFNSNQQNFIGCQLRDLTLDGTGSGANSIGFHVGGTQHTATNHVMIGFFSVGIEVENEANTWTERYAIEQTDLFRNGIGIWFHCDNGCSGSFGHGKIETWVNVDNDYNSAYWPQYQPIAMRISNDTPVPSPPTGSVQLYGTDIIINGNLEGSNPSVDQTIDVGGGVYLQNIRLMTSLECMGSGCALIHVEPNGNAALDQVGMYNGQFKITLDPASGSLPAGTLKWTNLSTGPSLYSAGLPATGAWGGSGFNTSQNIYAGTNPLNGAPNDANTGDIYATRNGNPAQGTYLFGGNGATAPAGYLDFGSVHSGQFTFSGGNVEIPAPINDCSGFATLSSGAATVTAACVNAGRPVICTDQSSASPVQCQPGAGVVIIHGTGSDVISWVRE
jgi:hypothetical protein